MIDFGSATEIGKEIKSYTKLYGEKYLENNFFATTEYDLFCLARIMLMFHEGILDIKYNSKELEMTLKQNDNFFCKLGLLCLEKYNLDEIKNEIQKNYQIEINWPYLKEN